MYEDIYGFYYPSLLDATRCCRGQYILLTVLHVLYATVQEATLKTKVQHHFQSAEKGHAFTTIC